MQGWNMREELPTIVQCVHLVLQVIMEMTNKVIKFSILLVENTKNLFQSKTLGIQRPASHHLDNRLIYSGYIYILYNN